MLVWLTILFVELKQIHYFVRSEQLELLRTLAIKEGGLSRFSFCCVQNGCSTKLL